MISKKWKILHVRTCQIWRKIKNCQTCWKPSILLPKVVTWWSTGYDIGRVDLKRSCSRSPVSLFSKKWKILHVRTYQIWRKIINCQTCWKPSILLPKVVTWWSTGYDIGRADIKRSYSRSLVPWFSKKVKNFTCPDLSSLTENRKFSNLLKTIHTTSYSGFMIINRLWHW